MYIGRGQVQQCDQSNRSRLDLAEYVMWKSHTKLATWVSLDVGIHLDSSSVSSYPSQITLYRSLHAHQQSILKFTI